MNRHEEMQQLLEKILGYKFYIEVPKNPQEYAQDVLEFVSMSPGHAKGKLMQALMKGHVMVNIAFDGWSEHLFTVVVNASTKECAAVTFGCDWEQLRTTFPEANKYSNLEITKGARAYLHKALGLIPWSDTVDSIYRVACLDDFHAPHNTNNDTLH